MVARVEVIGLSRSFPGVVALDNVDLSVEPGEIRALLGENGAGKSTLGKIVAGIHPPSAGSVRIDGVAVQIADERAAGARGIGSVPQDGSLVRNSAWPRISLPGASRWAGWGRCGWPRCAPVLQR